jgi:hypothetical protein
LVRRLNRPGRISGFVTVLSLAVAVLLPNVARAEGEISEEARQHFRAGVSFLQDPDGARYEEAYREFKAAYAASPSWKILGNLGLSAMKLERDGDAVDAFEKYLAQGGDQIDATERAQVERDLQTLRVGLVTLTLQTVPVGATFVDQRVPNRGEAIMNKYDATQGPLVVRVRSGLHRITARLAGYEDSVWEVDAAAGSSASHSFELKKLAPAQAPHSSTTTGERPTPTSVYVGLAATGVLTAGAVVTGVLALGKKGEFDDANEARSADASDLRDETQTMNLVTDVLIGGAVVGAAVTSYLYFTRPVVTPQDTALRFSPVAGPTGAGMTMWGRF